MQLIGEVNRRALQESIGILFGPSHVALLVNRVIVALIGNRGYSNGGLVKVGILEDGVQTHRTAATPTPHRHALRIKIRSPHQNLAYGCSLLPWGHNPDLLERRFAPGATFRNLRSSVVETHDDVALLSQHHVPQVMTRRPAISDRLPCRLSVDVDQERITRVRLHRAGLDTPRIQLNALLDLDLKELCWRTVEFPHLEPQLIVRHQRLDDPVIRQRDQFDSRRVVDRADGMDRPLAVGGDVIFMPPLRILRSQPLKSRTVQSYTIKILPRRIVRGGL